MLGIIFRIWFFPGKNKENFTESKLVLCLFSHFPFNWWPQIVFMWLLSIKTTIRETHVQCASHLPLNRNCFLAKNAWRGQSKLKHWKVLLPRFRWFFFNKCLPGCYKLLISFQSSDKVDFNSFCKFICCFSGGTGFWSSLLCHFHQCLSHYWTFKN